jgi:hypothetical protein
MCVQVASAHGVCSCVRVCVCVRMRGGGVAGACERESKEATCYRSHSISLVPVAIEHSFNFALERLRLYEETPTAEAQRKYLLVCQQSGDTPSNTLMHQECLGGHLSLAVSAFGSCGGVCSCVHKTVTFVFLAPGAMLAPACQSARCGCAQGPVRAPRARGCGRARLFELGRGVRHCERRDACLASGVITYVPRLSRARVRL